MNPFLIEYIEQRVVRMPWSGCWIWMLYAMPNGYGGANARMRVGSLAHRVSWIAHYGSIPDDAMVLHRCDVRLCCNPAHLFLGSAQDNTDDMVAKQRHKRGEHLPQTKLTTVEVRAIRADPRVQRVIAEEYGVTQTTISRAKRGVGWRHLTN